MTEPTYTLEQARTELAHRECKDQGHNLTLIDTRTFGGEHAPVEVNCDRCDRHWDIGPGQGGINLGEPTTQIQDGNVTITVNLKDPTNPDLTRALRHLVRIGDPSIMDALRRTGQERR